MKKNKVIVVLTSMLVLFNLTTSLAMGIGLTKEDARKENRNLEKKLSKQVETIANKYKYRENEFEVKKCFAFGGDSTTDTDRTIIMEVCSSKTFDEEDVLTIYTNILKEVRGFNKSSKVIRRKILLQRKQVKKTLHQRLLSHLLDSRWLYMKFYVLSLL